MAEPQYYHGAIRLPDGTWVTTKYQDGLPPEVASQVSADLSDTRIWERRPFLCVPLPGRSAWTVPQNAAAGRSLAWRALVHTAQLQPDTPLILQYAHVLGRPEPFVRCHLPQGARQGPRQLRPLLSACCT